MEPSASVVYVNMLSDEGEAGVRRAYSEAKWRRLAELKARFDPDNVFHLNANIAPSKGGGRRSESLSPNSGSAAGHDTRRISGR